MAQRPKARERKAANAAPFIALLEQMERLIGTIDLDWPKPVRMDAMRRLTRLERALRHAPETRERL
jgi:hypothetical protein